MDRHDGLGPLRNGGGDEGRVDVEGARIDIDEDGLGPHQADGLGGGEEGEGGGDHLVAGAHAQRAQADDERVGARVEADGVPDAQVVGHLFLEGLDLGSEDEAPRVEDAPDGRLDLGPEGFNLRPWVVDGDLDLAHVVRSTRSSAVMR